MTVLDWTLLGILLLSSLVGVWRGLVFEVLSVLGWAAAFFVAQWLAPLLAVHLPMDALSDPLRYAAAFVLIFVVTVFIAGLLASLLRRLTAAVGLRPVDRLMGAAFGLVRGVLMVLALAVVVEMTPLKSSPWWLQSQGAPLLSLTLAGLKPALPEGFARFLP